MGGGISHLKTIKEMKLLQPWPTITFLDWDDTLFPTSWLSDLGMLRNTERPSDAEQLAELDRLDDAASSMLASVLRFSTQTCIVTNALKNGWVTESARIFLPKMHALLESPNCPTIVYAMDKLTQKHFSQFRRKLNMKEVFGGVSEKLSPDEFAEIMTTAKVVAMQPEIEAFYSMYPQRHWQNVVSIGDGTSERNAIQEITFIHEQPPEEKLRTKIIKTVADPTSSEVISQLQTINKYLSTIVHFNGDLDVDFEHENANERLAEALHTLLDEKIRCDKSVCDAIFSELKCESGTCAPECNSIFLESHVLTSVAGA
jgi:hypothetical protein